MKVLEGGAGVREVRQAALRLRRAAPSPLLDVVLRRLPRRLAHQQQLQRVQTQRLVRQVAQDAACAAGAGAGAVEGRPPDGPTPLWPLVLLRQQAQRMGLRRRKGLPQQSMQRNALIREPSIAVAGLLKRASAALDEVLGTP